MPKARFPYLQKHRTRHKKTVWYFRRGKGKRIRIHGDYGSEEFVASYNAALAGIEHKRRPATTGTLAWLIARYMESADWKSLGSATRKQRSGILTGVKAKAGDEPYAEITQATIEQSVEDRMDSPFGAASFMKAIRGLFKWAAKAKHIAADPTAGVKVKTPKTRGYHTWTEGEVQKYEKRWPLGTKERVWLALLLYTGFRRGDAAVAGPNDVHEVVARDEANEPILGEDGKPTLIKVISLTTEKNGIDVDIPVLPVLQDALDAGPIGTETFIVGSNGGALTKETFGNYFRDACVEAGVPGRAHGLRKAGATRAANNGASERQLNAIFGWADGSDESATYTREADRKRLARNAITKIAA